MSSRLRMMFHYTNHIKLKKEIEECGFLVFYGGVRAKGLSTDRLRNGSNPTDRLGHECPHGQRTLSVILVTQKQKGEKRMWILSILWWRKG